MVESKKRDQRVMAVEGKEPKRAKQRASKQASKQANKSQTQNRFLVSDAAELEVKAARHSAAQRSAAKLTHSDSLSALRFATHKSQGQHALCKVQFVFVAKEATKTDFRFTRSRSTSTRTGAILKQF